MAIEIKTEEGAVIKFDSVEEYREFMIINENLDPVPQEEGVNMENLPIGTLVKVVGNRAGHEHEVGEILPITEVGEDVDEPGYRLDDRRAGWVSVDDIEFVSFPEEEESTSGDEGLAVDEDESEKYPAVGTKVKAKRETPWTTVGKVYEVLSITESSPYPIIVTDDEDDDIYTLKMFEEFFEILKPLGQDANGVVLYEGDTITVTEQSSGESEEDSEIKAGDIVIATEDEFDITEGAEYEIQEYRSGTLYFLDDDGDVRHVNIYEEILRKKSDKRGFKKGDVVYVNEEITDNSGDSIRPGVLTEFILNRGVLTPDGSLVVVGDGDIGNLTLVCRAEDRLDK